MLPGFVSGFYSFDECHIDLVRLARYCNARLIAAAATGVDLTGQAVTLDGGRPPLPYDLLSINTGIAPAASQVPGAREHTIPVKPIASFAARLEAVVAAATAGGGPFRVAVVGGGPSGVELACAVQHRLGVERQRAGIDAPAGVTLVSRGQILGGLAPYARAAFLPLLAARGVAVSEDQGGVACVEPGRLILGDGSALPYDACLWCTQAGAPGWLAASGLPTDPRGFLLVNDCLQTDGGPNNVFGAGDCVANAASPRPKAGVYAVRAGPPLADNLAAAAQGRPLRPWTPQTSHLNLISAGDRYAVAVKGRWLGARGSLLWTLKDWIDRRFMAAFGSDLDFEGMAGRKERGTDAAALGPEAAALAAAAAMRCGGCGAKVGADPLSRVLARLQRDDDAASGGDAAPGGKLDEVEDAAVLPPPPPGCVTVQSVDFFRAPECLDDPYVFGAIAAAHALSDCYAVGAAPTSAQAIAVLPFAAEKIVERDLYQLMAGARSVLRDAGCDLVGGHSCEGAELALGLVVNGAAPAAALQRKRGLAPGQVLILTKPLGTGLVMAAAARGLAQGRWVAAAVGSMRQSNASAAAALAAAGAAACTDVTGFGLLGHLAEMARASGMEVEVDAGAVPALEGAVAAAAAGAVSSLAPANAKVAAAVSNAAEAVALPQWPLLIDPQTSGGLLAAVPAAAAEAAVAELRRQGCPAAAVVGRVRGPAAEGQQQGWITVNP